MTDTANKPKAPAKPKKTAAKKASVTTITKAPSHEEIAQLAHHYWVERGRQHGHHAEDWRRAEEELRGKAS